MTIKILVLASNPSGTEQLQLNPEIRSIEDSHERSEKRAEFIVIPKPAIRISELQRIILKEKPRIVHFCGHGTGHQGLVLENDARQPQLVSTEALTNLLKIFERRIECVVLNACHSHVQGKQINQHVNFLIATKKEIHDDAALLFTKGFYDALFNGETYKDAYELGCNRIHLESYKGNSLERKLVPVYSGNESKYIDLPQHEILLFLEKKPPNIIFKNDIPISNYTYQENVEDESKTKNPLPCPYRGLLHFNPNDAEFFFGRDVFVEELFQATQTQTFIPVLGASGSGKSSVVLAGLVPRLEQEGNWKFAHFRPGDEPFNALAKALVPLYEADLNQTEQLKQSRQLAEYFVEGCVLLKDVFAQIESNYPNQRVLLITDQFEELYTLCPQEKNRHSFLDLLLACFQSPPSSLQLPPVLVTTMRADFLGNALAYRPLADVLNPDIKLGAMNREELSQVIVKPAAMLGVEFEPGLVDRILDDVEDEPGNLALLEFALTELWKEQTGNQLTHKAYENIGKVEGALAKYAEQKYQELNKNEKEQARQIFIQLVRLGEGNNDTRRRVNRNQLGEDSWDLVTRKQGLADSRLVVTNRDNNDREILEIVHEALIRHWQQLRHWLDENRDALRKQREIEEAAKTWAEYDKPLTQGFLWEGYKLAEAEKVLSEYADTVTLSTLAQEFIEECRKQELRSYLLDPASDNLDQMGLEKEAGAKSFLTKSRLWHLLEDESEKAEIRLAASWGLKQWGEEVPMWLAEIEEEEAEIEEEEKKEKISLHILEPPPTVGEDLGNGITLEMVKIPGGEFWMGASAREEGSYRDEFPQHQVRVSPFFMGKYPVTQAQWRAVASLPGVERKLDLDPSYFKGDNRPVESVSWDDAVEFCKRLARETGRDYRLPSEAEWEYACRAGSTTPYQFGQTISPSLANYIQDRGRGRTTTVGRFQVANGFGLYDMHGNVWEWCEDNWHDDYEGAPTDGSAWKRRGGLGSWIKGTSSKNVVRGGSWVTDPVGCRSATRIGNTRDDRSCTFGFRVVCVVPRTT